MALQRWELSRRHSLGPGVGGQGAGGARAWAMHPQDRGGVRRNPR